MKEQLILPRLLYPVNAIATRSAFATTALEIVEWVQRRMRRADGIQRLTPEPSRGYVEFVARHHQFR